MTSTTQTPTTVPCLKKAGGGGGQPHSPHLPSPYCDSPDKTQLNHDIGLQEHRTATEPPHIPKRPHIRGPIAVPQTGGGGPSLQPPPPTPQLPLLGRTRPPLPRLGLIQALIGDGHNLLQNVARIVRGRGRGGHRARIPRSRGWGSGTPGGETTLKGNTGSVRCHQPRRVLHGRRWGSADNRAPKPRPPPRPRPPPNPPHLPGHAHLPDHAHLSRPRPPPQATPTSQATPAFQATPTSQLTPIPRPRSPLRPRPQPLFGHAHNGETLPVVWPRPLPGHACRRQNHAHPLLLDAPIPKTTPTYSGHAHRFGIRWS